MTNLAVVVVVVVVVGGLENDLPGCCCCSCGCWRSCKCFTCLLLWCLLEVLQMTYLVDVVVVVEMFVGGLENN